jgi:hypothetical protein
MTHICFWKRTACAAFSIAALLQFSESVPLSLHGNG